MKLLSVGTNAKTIKSDEIQNKYLTAIMYLAPAETSGLINTCPMATEGCKVACLFTAGRGVYNNVQEARKRKTAEFVNNRAEFLNVLREDIRKFIKKCNKEGKLPAVRLNGTSDIQFEHFGIIQEFPNVQWYDYTKLVKRMGNVPSNYHLTFSRSETNWNECKYILDNKLGNVAIVFADKDSIPSKYMGYKVINGDEHDLRFLDKTNVIVGLYAKGKARKDTTNFVVR